MAIDIITQYIFQTGIQLVVYFYITYTNAEVIISRYSNFNVARYNYVDKKYGFITHTDQHITFENLSAGTEYYIFAYYLSGGEPVEVTGIGIRTPDYVRSKSISGRVKITTKNPEKLGSAYGYTAWGGIYFKGAETYTSDISGIVRVNAKNTATISGRVRIEKSKETSISGQVRIEKSLETSISGMVRVNHPQSASISGRVRIRVTTPEKLPVRWDNYEEPEPKDWGEVDKNATEWDNVSKPASAWTENDKIDTSWGESDKNPTEWEYPLEEAK